MIPIEYNDSVERRRINPLLLNKKESEPLPRSDTQVLEKVKIIVPRKVNVWLVTETKQGASEFILAKQKIVITQRSVWDCERHSLI